MDLNVIRAMNEIAPSFSRSSYPRLSSTPASNFITPGIGHITRLYNTYVPIRVHKNFPHEMKKHIEPIVISQEIIEDNQIGSGTLEQTKEAAVKPEIDSIASKGPNSVSLSKGIEFSFAHPRIETDKIVFETKKRSPNSEKSDSVPSKKTKFIADKSSKVAEQKIKHKFQFV